MLIPVRLPLIFLFSATLKIPRPRPMEEYVKDMTAANIESHEI
ncbi:hypothetical protein HanIR_Chr05g0236201 [Helianthus annuus]|nr:hypothetical protein HanIR_Chr05g0236201 [Helianthus annuus]